MKIKSVTHIKRDKTLDIEVNHPEHQFYCNGILTSNSHSISYTYTSLREYYLKTYYDPEFNIALLNNTSKGKESKGTSVIALYITEMIKKGYKIIGPDINRSESLFSLANNDLDCKEIVWGLSWIKNLSDVAISKIVEERNKNGVYSSIEDLFNRVGKKLLNKRSIDALVWSGALDIFGDRASVHEKIYTEIRKDKEYKKQLNTEKALISKEIDYCSISLKEIVMFSRIKKEVEKATDNIVDPLFEVDQEGNYFCVGKIESLENKKTKTKKDYIRISLRDETKLLRSIYCWPWKVRNIYELKKNNIIIASIENDGKFKNLVNWFPT